MKITLSIIPYVFCIILPIPLAILWVLKTKGEKVLKISHILIGAGAFSLAQQFEFLFSNFIYGLSASFVMYNVGMSIFPGIFEEMARFTFFYLIINTIKNRDRKTSISYGIGHGGGFSLCSFIYNCLPYLLDIRYYNFDNIYIPFMHYYRLIYLEIPWIFLKIIFNISMSIIMCKIILEKKYWFCLCAVLANELFNLFYIIWIFIDTKFTFLFSFIMPSAIDLGLSIYAFLLYKKMEDEELIQLIEVSDDNQSNKMY